MDQKFQNPAPLPPSQQDTRSGREGTTGKPQRFTPTSRPVPMAPSVLLKPKTKTTTTVSLVLLFKVVRKKKPLREPFASYGTHFDLQIKGHFGANSSVNSSVKHTHKMHLSI
jgi:hypothetical protein